MPASNVTMTATYRIIDTVGDGIPDTWRATYFPGDGTSTNALSEVGADPDSDGLNNWAEYVAGTSPIDTGDVFEFSNMQISGDVIDLSFLSAAGLHYQLEGSPSLVAPDWVTVMYNIVGDGMWKHPHFIGTIVSNNFYRLRTM